MREPLACRGKAHLHLAALHRRVATNKRTFSLNWEQHLVHVWEHNSPKWLQYVSCVAATIFNHYLPAFAYVGQWNHGCERKEDEGHQEDAGALENNNNFFLLQILWVVIFTWVRAKERLHCFSGHYPFINHIPFFHCVLCTPCDFNNHGLQTLWNTNLINLGGNRFAAHRLHDENANYTHFKAATKVNWPLCTRMHLLLSCKKLREKHWMNERIKGRAWTEPNVPFSWLVSWCWLQQPSQCERVVPLCYTVTLIYWRAFDGLKTITMKCRRLFRANDITTFLWW